jgi:hypothetical protein
MVGCPVECSEEAVLWRSAKLWLEWWPCRRSRSGSISRSRSRSRSRSVLSRSRSRSRSLLSRSRSRSLLRLLKRWLE